MAFQKRKRDYPWLTGDNNGAYCDPCKRLYEGKQQASNHGVFVSRPFVNWKKSTGSKPEDNKLLKHQLSNAHKTAISASEQSRQLHQSGAGSVLGLLTNMSEEQKKENLEILTDFARILHFIVLHELPQTTTYRPLIDLVKDCDHSNRISKWLQRAPDSASYTSATIATELLEVFGNYIKGQIKEEILSSRYVALMADEATDIRNRQELSICCRYITNSGEPKESFIDMVILDSTTADHIDEKLKLVCEEYSITSEKLQWQAYDGAANFSGKL